jgi:hypothetical protein
MKLWATCVNWLTHQLVYRSNRHFHARCAHSSFPRGALWAIPAIPNYCRFASDHPPPLSRSPSAVHAQNDRNVFLGEFWRLVKPLVQVGRSYRRRYCGWGR